MIRIPPMIAAAEGGWPVRSQSAMATRKMVSSAATDERTGEVSEMRTRKEPENANLRNTLLARTLDVIGQRKLGQ